jgi:aryl-alcohol dehydrogenase-like predicted oxidoreductase
MITRRKFLGTSLGAGAALALAPPLDVAPDGPELVEGPELLRAQQQSAGTLIQRAIPSTGEMLPVIGLGRGSRPADPAALMEVVKTLVENGGRIVDTTAGGSAAEDASGAAAHDLGIQDRIFWSSLLVGAPPRPPNEPPPPKADAAAVRAQIETKLAKFKVPKIDMVMVGAYAASKDPTYLGVLREMKKEGRVRYIGVDHLAFPPTSRDPFGDLEAIIRNEPIDFIGTDYHVADRRVEQEILPLAQQRKIGFMAHFTFDRGRLFTRASGTPLPDWAAEFDARTWAQFFLKYVISHPAVTIARTGTTKAAHMLENIGGGIGRLPNEATRKRMAALVDSLPPTP